jgi:nucleotidyltransferase/DNA polymerase involved in DNA repair
MRYVVYVDMDAYYVSCEVRDRPELEGLPVIVGRRPEGPASRGVVLSASYAARAFGVRSALPVVLAAQKCPDAVWIPPDFPKYDRIAGELRLLLSRWSDNVVPLSIDEAAVAVEQPDDRSVEAWARDVQASIRQELKLPCSIGASPYAVVAKIASDAAKPGGVRVVPATQTEAFLAPLPVRSIPGIGPKSAERLARTGVHLIQDLATADLEGLRKVLGRFADEVRDLARGRPGPGLAELPADSGPRQRSLDRTFAEDTRDTAVVLRHLEEMAQELAQVLEREGLRYQGVVVRLRWEDFTQTQRGHHLGAAREGVGPLAAEAARLARELLEREHADRGRAVRRVSLAAERLLPRTGRQDSLESFEDVRPSR